jgi:hypothetical protein
MWLNSAAAAAGSYRYVLKTLLLRAERAICAVEASIGRVWLHWCGNVALEKAGGVWRVEISEHFSIGGVGG